MSGNNIIGFVDTAISSSSLGEQFIVDDCKFIIGNRFPSHFQVSHASHCEINSYAEFKMRQADHIFVCGTNLLCPDYADFAQWHCRNFASFENKPILMGVGWQSYSTSTTSLSAEIYESALNDKYIH